MRITIIGWYGTETIGDRAILAGILKIFFSVTKDIQLCLGSLYPFYSERTLLEDMDFFRAVTGVQDLDIALFDSMKRKELNSMIDQADLVCVSGGPLMDMPCMYMLEYALKRAKRRRRKTALIGCGFGPLHKKMYLTSACRLVRYSDCTIFRDKMSNDWYNEAVKKQKESNVANAICPSALAAKYYQDSNGNQMAKTEQIVFSGRELRETAYSKTMLGTIQEKIYHVLQKAAAFGMPIVLVPMHTFAIGEDDRVLLNRLRNRLIAGNPTADIIVLDKPLNLEQTMRSFSCAEYCIGTRYHSIVLQTLLNGNNYILDYTDPAKGKTSAFLHQIGGFDFYRKRYVNLQTDESFRLVLEKKKFECDPSLLHGYEDIYLSQIKSLLDQ